MWANHFRKFQLRNMSMWKIIEFFHDSRLIRWIEQKVFTTRMHSSRMRTARLLPVSPSMHCSGGVPARGEGCTCLGGVPAQGWGCTCPEGVPAQGVYLPGGVYLTRGVPVQVFPLPMWTECQTGAKLLPCPYRPLQWPSREGGVSPGCVHPTPSPIWTEWQMLVKTLPFCNYCCGQ